VPSEAQHHTSKKRSYTIVLVPDEDATNARNYRFTPWQVAVAFLVSILAVLGAAFSVVIYTPLGAYLPITNPELENKYNKELVSLNRKMVGVMEELVDLRAYNVKLRNALGENVVATDSGVVNVPDGDAQPVPQKSGATDEQSQSKRFAETLAGVLLQSAATTTQPDIPARVAFPAILPTMGYITQGYEPAQRHFGIDIAGKTGTPVVAAADGYVVFSGWTQDDGNLVILSHSDGFMTFYKHNNMVLKPANIFVKRGEPIATLGSSGRTSSAPHLHFEIWKDGSPVDPTLYVLDINS